MVTEKICKDKNCEFKNQYQPVTNFGKNKNTKDGLSDQCKSCKKRYNLENRDIIREKHKQIYEENKESYHLYHKKRYEENKKELSEKSKQYRLSKTRFDSTYFEKLKKYEPVRQDPENLELLQVQCSKCQNWFNPTNQQVFARLCAIKGTSTQGAEMRFYCSKSCKNECPIFKQRTRLKTEKKKTDVTKRRPLQSELREMVLKRDNNTCQICGLQFLKEDLTCHHITGVEINPIESADIDNCVSLCKKCNSHAHRLPGCKKVEMSCKSQKNHQIVIK